MAPESRPRVIPTSRVLALVVVLSLIIGFILFPFSPSAGELEAGTEAEQTLVSPKDVAYVSTTQTESQRDAAVEAVVEVLDLNPAIREGQIAALDQLLESILAIRQRTDLNFNQKLSELGELDDPPIDPAAGILVLESTDEEWTRIEDESRRVLGLTLGEPLAEDQVEPAREALAQSIDQSLPDDLAIVTEELTAPFIVANLVGDEGATQAAREAARAEVTPVEVTFAEGDVIVRRGEVITESDLEALEEADLLSPDADPEDVLGASLVAILVACAVGGYLYYLQPRSLASDRRLALVVLAYAASLLAAKLFLPEVIPDTDRRFFALMLPVAAAPMLIASLLDDTPFALLSAAIIAGVSGFAAYYLPEHAGGIAGDPLDALLLVFAYFCGSVAGVFAVRNAAHVSQYFIGGAAVTLASTAGALSVDLLDPAWQIEDIFWIFAGSGAAGVLAAVLTLGCFVLVGTVFGITTRLQLVEMADLNHPLLRRLQEEAPGTFHHSVLVGSLAERAANAIGADALQARIGAFYHDIGKMAKPRYYIENTEEGRNPHDELDPVASARIVADHVRNGLELARKNGVPPVIRDFIPQHHGTRLVTYFYRKAAQTTAQLDVEKFRYPGPRPQRRETAIVMLADSIEAITRAREDKSAESIDFAVEGIIRERLQEGQLDESDLTLRDLQKVAAAFKSTLRGVYHARIEYPAPTPQERRDLEESGDTRPDPFERIG
jgi:cyclic-di-AMP phosphodiesterase PgpH